jgi:RNA polymerase sigma factor (sigma-70 family)
MKGHDQLIQGCLQQHRASQKQLYSEFAEQMLGVCYRYTKSLADAEDVMQEGFVKVFKNLQQYKGIMVNTALNYLKRNSKYQGDLSFDNVTMHPVADDDPQMLLDTRELVNLLRQLPAGYQLIFNLYAVEGYTHVEIGKQLGISETTSRSQYSRARALLITWIKKNYSDNKLQSYV